MLSLISSSIRSRTPRLVVNTSSSPSTTTRSVHSKRQIKRLMAPYHPAFRRKARKNGIPIQTGIAIPTPKFEAIGEPVLLSNGWSQPLVQSATERPEYPFQVRRTKNKPMGAVGFLPVYTKTRHDGTKVTTLVKGVTGDRDAFQQELRAVLQTPKPFRLRSMGTVIEVPGDNVARIKTWLTGLGF